MQQQRISNTDGLITPAAYATARGLNRSTISRQIKRGVIPVHDGKVNPMEADTARRNNLHIRRGGPKVNRATVEDVPLELDYGARSVFEAVIAASVRIPEILCGLGVRDQAVLAISAELFVDLVFELAQEPAGNAYDWLREDCSITPAVNLRKLAKRYGFKFDPEAARTDYKAGREQSAAEQLVDRFDELLYVYEAHPQKPAATGGRVIQNK